MGFGLSIWSRTYPVAAHRPPTTPKIAMNCFHFPLAPMVRRMTALVGIATLALTPGCVIVSDSGHDVSGSFVSRSTLEQIEPGVTKGYVTTLLGDPTSQTPVDGLTEVWRWTSYESRNSSAKVFLLLSDTNRSQVARSTFVEFADGVVSKAWQD